MTYAVRIFPRVLTAGSPRSPPFHPVHATFFSEKIKAKPESVCKKVWEAKGNSIELLLASLKQDTVKFVTQASAKS
jgi:hypothetical protein